MSFLPKGRIKGLGLYRVSDNAKFLGFVLSIHPSISRAFVFERFGRLAHGEGRDEVVLQALQEHGYVEEMRAPK
jgi:hypothetical protein